MKQPGTKKIESVMPLPKFLRHMWQKNFSRTSRLLTPIFTKKCSDFEAYRIHQKR